MKKYTVEELGINIKQEQPFRIFMLGIVMFGLITLMVATIGDLFIFNKTGEEFIFEYRYWIGITLLFMILDTANEVQIIGLKIKRLELLVLSEASDK